MSGGVLVTCDLICLGAASPGAFQAYVRWLEGRAGRKVVSYAHRGGGERWGAYEERAGFSDGAVEAGTTRTRAWKRTWGKHLLRPSCHSCAYHSVERPGDLTIGDYWGLEDAHPGASDDLGVSCLLVNSSRGMRVVRSISGKIALLPSSVDKCANGRQPMLRRSPELPGQRALFWERLCEGGFHDACVAVGALGAGRAAKDSARAVLAKARRTSPAPPEGLGKGEWAEADLGEGALGYPVVFAARHRSDEVRRRSSSGGMFHALAEYAVERGGVVYGCAFDEGLRARHVRCETMGECERCMGSKYSQSDMGDAIRRVREDLGDGRLVLFTGTPCQVDAVRHACGPSEGRRPRTERAGGGRAAGGDGGLAL